MTCAGCCLSSDLCGGYEFRSRGICWGLGAALRMNLQFGSKVPGAGLAPAEGGTVSCLFGD